MMLMLAVPGSANASAEQLAQEAAVFAGQPVRLDARLAIPRCTPSFSFRAAEAGDGVEASCPETGWRMRLPLAAAQKAVMPRRGQAMRVEVVGPGYRATVDEIVKSANAREGTVFLKNPRSGARFIGHLRPDGRVLASYSVGR